jgi:hypothetical protein
VAAGKLAPNGRTKVVRKRKRAAPRLTANEVVVRAEKKLRQADFFAGNLAAMRRPGLPEEMEFYLSASLSAARSAFYIVRDHGGPTFRQAQKAWRRAHQPADIDFHDRMTERRDDDVHHGEVNAASLNRWVNAQTAGWSRWSMFSSYPFDAQVEQTNPDGTKVRGHVLTTVPTLYINDAETDIEATAACQKFIGLLRDLVGQFKSAAGTGTTV